jgi:hypothetical protein
MSVSNKFSILTNDDNDNTIVYDSNGNIDLEAMIPEYKVLNDAIKYGVSWYDLMYPDGETTGANNTNTESKKEIDEWTSVENKASKKRSNRTTIPIMSEPPKKRTRFQ